MVVVVVFVLVLALVLLFGGGGSGDVWDRLEEGYENLWIVEQPCEQAKGLSKKWAMGEPCVGNVSSSGSEWFLLVPHWGNG